MSSNKLLKEELQLVNFILLILKFYGTVKKKQQLPLIWLYNFMFVVNLCIKTRSTERRTKFILNGERIF